MATDGGVSVIKDDGTVADSTQTVAMLKGWLGDNNRLFYSDDSSDQVYYADTYAADGFNSGGAHYDTDAAPYTLAGNVVAGVNGAFGHADGVTFLHENPTTPANGMVAYTTSTYNTGWMVGDIKGAFLSDTDDTDLVGSGELVTNGDDWTGATGGALPDGATNVGWYETSNGTYSVASGVITITNGTNGRTGFYFPVSVTQGETYEVEWVGQTGSTQVRITDSINPSATTPFSSFNRGATGRASFVSTSNTLYVSVTNYNSTDGDSSTLDKVSLKLADADRSVNNKGLIVNGTVTRTPVATGADLVGYSGFSETNYLEGTDATYADTLYALGWEQTAGVWEFKHGVVSAAPIDGLTITGTTLKIAGTKPKALVRVTATTPTASQLAKIQADEKVLFQDGAQATLFGASDAVTALAHDPVTDLLHVGTSAGRSVFQGLRRVSNTTTAVGTAISASNGLVVEE